MIGMETSHTKGEYKVDHDGKRGIIGGGGRRGVGLKEDVAPIYFQLIKTFAEF